MALAILLSLAASFCTATSSVCQRLGARGLDAREPGVTGFDPYLVFRLARRPVWVLGFSCMIGGFGFQMAALHFGPLALVQPVMAVELVVVFAYLAVLTRAKGVRLREWLAAVAMSAGLSVFLRAASPSGGQPHGSALAWWVSGLVICVVVGAAVTVATLSSAHHFPVRRAAFLGIATGTVWGFVAAVIKEMTAHFSGGLAAVFGNWSVYVLIIVGAGAMLLASHAMTAGPLAASQPGFTLLDPVVAILLGVFLFGERLQASPAAVVAEILGLCVLAAGVAALSHSPLITSPTATAQAVRGGKDRRHTELTRKTR